VNENPGRPPFVERRRTEDRRAGSDRRGSARGGRRISDAVVGGILLSQLAAVSPVAAADAVANGLVVRTGRRASDVRVLDRPALAAAPLRFGTEVKSLARARSQGLSFEYGVTWAGAWNQKYGWDAVRRDLREARARGATPVVQWWYWGDEISPAALRDGVTDKRHGVMKDRAAWLRLSGELADVIKTETGGGEAIVVLETEFNKQGIEDYDPFDAMLAEQAQLFRSRANARVALGFGNWGTEKWGRFAKAIAASDMLGTQLLRSSVREPGKPYLSAVDTLVSGARTLGSRFGKPVLVMDLALSTYPSTEYEAHQAAVLRELFARTPELKQAGVVGIIWRQIVDDPKFDTSNYHGMAERYWGVVRADGSPKPGLAVLRDGIRAESAPVRVAGPTS
jgi:hypothetical protein